MFLNNLFIFALVVCAFGGMNLANYKVTWDQDFSTMSKLNVTSWGPGSTWIAHTPSAKDWVNFMDPSGPYLPFNVGNGFLTIRAQELNGKYYGGLLCSVDPKGNGFSQKYGYFEMSAQLPIGPSTWPAFWLLDVESLKDNSNSVNSEEIDILEQYGDGGEGVGILHTTLHYWDRSNSTKTWGYGTQHIQCSMTTGFHTYGLDIQPDTLTFYYDRLAIWQQPNNVPGLLLDKFDRAFFVLVNLAPWNDFSKLTGHPQDMLVKYVKVWQGSGGSANAFATDQSNAVTYPTSGLSLSGGQEVDIINTKLKFTTQGNLEITDSAGKLIWQTGTSESCQTGCVARFQNDGNFVFFKDNKPYWASNSYNNNMGSMLFSNSAPYLQIMDGKCNTVWSTKVSN